MKIKELMMPIFSIIYSLILFLIFGLTMGPVYILWTSLGSIPITISFVIMIIFGTKTKNKAFFFIMSFVKMVIFALCIILVGYLSNNDILAFICLAAGFSTIMLSILTYYIIVPLFKRKEVKA